MHPQKAQDVSLPLSGLSILVSCYNKVEFVEPIFKVFKNLANLGAKVIVIDDGSTDGSSDLLVEMKEKANFDLILQRTENQGAAGARDSALLLAETDFIFYLDIDDTPNIEGLCELYKKYSNSQVDVAQGNFRFTETGQLGETVSCSNDYMVVQTQHHRDRIFETKGWWRFIYRRDFLLREENRLNQVFSVMQGKKFVLDDIYWMLHLAAIDLSVLESPSETVIYNYYLPEYNGDERWASYLRQVALIPEATTLYLRSLESHNCKHDDAWLYRNLFWVIWHHAPLLSLRSFIQIGMKFFHAGRLVSAKLGFKYSLLNVLNFVLTPLKIMKRSFLESH